MIPRSDSSRLGALRNFGFDFFTLEIRVSTNPDRLDSLPGFLVCLERGRGSDAAE